LRGGEEGKLSLTSREKEGQRAAIFRKRGAIRAVDISGKKRVIVKRLLRRRKKKKPGKISFWKSGRGEKGGGAPWRFV